MRATDLGSPTGAAALAVVTLPGWAGESRRGLEALLRMVLAALGPIEAAVQRVAAADPIVHALDALPGFGPVLALTARVEIGDIRRFPSAAHLASYAGVVPRVSASAGRIHYGPITKQGSAWLRWALVEAAIHGTRRPDAFGRWARQLAVRRGGLKARVAIARALCTKIYRAWPR